MATGWRGAAIVETEALTPAVRRVVLEPDEPIAFRAGQYLHLRDHRGFESPFSIASPPAHSRLEFLLSSRSVSDAVFRQVGERVEYLGPFGSLGVAIDAPGHLFAATGSGIAPIRSMILDRWGAPNPPPALLLLGHRSLSDLPFLAELTALSERFDRFELVPLVTREEAPGVRRARVTEALLARAPRCPGWTIYLCGRPEFVTEARASLRELGVPLERIRADYSG